MNTVNVFMDSSTANRIAELDDIIASRLDKRKTSQPSYREDKYYLTKIVDDFVKKGTVRLYWNASVKREIENTVKAWKRNAVLRTVEDHSFAGYHSTTFPIVMSDENPATFLNGEQKQKLKDIYNDLPKKYLRDIKILADALFNPEIEFLLTTDRQHLANKRLRSRIEAKASINILKIRTPRELFEDLKDKGITIDL